MIDSCAADTGTRNVRSCRAAAAAVPAPDFSAPHAKREIRQRGHNGKQDIIAQTHQNSLAIVYTHRRTNPRHGALHSTTPAVFTVEFSSRRIVATAAMQGV